MAFDIESSLTWLLTYLKGAGYGDASIGEPKSPPTNVQVFASVFMSNVSTVAITAGGATRELHVATVRFYRNLFNDPPKDTELTLAQAVSSIASAFLADADLGSTIVSIDVGGMYGDPLSAAWGHVEIGGTMFRYVDMHVPMIVDDSATVTP